MLTECPVLGAGDALVELSVSSCFGFAIGLEKDLNMSDCSLFIPAGLPAGFFSTSLGRSVLMLGATTACAVDTIDV